MTTSTTARVFVFRWISDSGWCGVVLRWFHSAPPPWVKWKTNLQNRRTWKARIRRRNFFGLMIIMACTMCESKLDALKLMIWSEECHYQASKETIKLKSIDGMMVVLPLDESDLKEWVGGEWMMHHHFFEEVGGGVDHWSNSRWWFRWCLNSIWRGEHAIKRPKLVNDAYKKQLIWTWWCRLYHYYITL